MLLFDCDGVYVSADHMAAAVDEFRVAHGRTPSRVTLVK